MNRRRFLSVLTAVIGMSATRDAARAAFGADFEPAIHEAAARHGTSGQWLIDVMYCESGGDPNAYNPRTGDSGLFQYQPDTYYRIFGGTDIWNPWEQIEITARAFASGYADHWVCSGVWDGSPS